MKVANDDCTLWQSFKEGDRSSFEAIYFSHFKNLYEYGMRIVADKELVKDSIHDLFVKLWNNKSSLGDVNAIRPYLFVSFRSTLYNKNQKYRRMATAEINEHYSFEMVFSVESDFVDKEVRSVQTQKIIAALNQLTPRQKEVIYLRYFEELDYEEIAVIMIITVKAIYKLMARGLEALRQTLDITNPSLLLFLALSKELFT